MNYFMVLESDYVIGVGASESDVSAAISESDYNKLVYLFRHKPPDPDGYTYKLRADNLEWELVELPPVEPEPQDEELTADEALDIILGGADE